MKTILKLLSTGSILFMLTPFALGSTLAAKKAGVKVYKDANKTSDTIQTLKKGETVESMERKGMFWKVTLSDKQTGYVSFLEVTRQADEGGSLSKAIQSAAIESRDMDDLKSARSRSAVMGVRGLDESDETSFAGAVKPNLRMVYAMEDRIPDQEKIDKLSSLVQKEVSEKSKKLEQSN